MGHDVGKSGSRIHQKRQDTAAPYSKTTEGFWVFAEPVILVGDADESLGAKILETLAFSAIGVPHPKSWQGVSKALYQTARAGSFGAINKSKGVSISQRAGQIELVPTL